MRKNKFAVCSLLIILALSMFLFSGCGGSAGGDSASDEVVYDNKVEKILAGTWKLSNSSSTGTATTTNGATTLSLTNPIQTEIIFSDLNLISSSSTNDDEAGTVYLYYYMNWSAKNSGADAGTFDIKSYSDSTITDKRKLMDIVHSDTNEWILTSRKESSSDSDRVNITITINDENEISISWNGSQYISKQKLRYNYELESNIRKSSTKTIPETVPDDDSESKGDEEETVKTIKEILTGTWKVVNPYKKIDVDFSEGGEMLLISSDVTFTEMNISGDVGSAVVSMDQNWRVGWEYTIYVQYYDVGLGEYAYREETAKKIGFTSFSLRDKTIQMTKNSTNTNKWRCYFDIPEDVTSTDVTIMRGTVMNVEITSDNTITIVHEGIVVPPNEYLQDNNISAKANLITYDQIDFDYIKK